MNITMYCALKKKKNISGSTSYLELCNMLLNQDRISHSQFNVVDKRFFLEKLKKKKKL